MLIGEAGSHADMRNPSTAYRLSVRVLDNQHTIKSSMGQWGILPV